jgi:hypothetical protein
MVPRGRFQQDGSLPWAEECAGLAGLAGLAGRGGLRGGGGRAAVEDDSRTGQ